MFKFFSRAYFAFAALAFALGFGLNFSLRLFFAGPEHSRSALAASFIVNLGVLAASLATLPERQSGAASRWRFLRAWLRVACLAAAGFGGVWAASAQQESARIFAALVLLSSAQSAALFAAYALLDVLCESRGRAPRLLCALGLALFSTALFWTREPILWLSKSGGALSGLSPRVSDGVMKLSPPVAVAAAWFTESDAARGGAGGATPRFDLVRGPLTYTAWIGSYQLVAVPGILPSGLSTDFYAREDFSPGIALILLLWALPLLALGGWLKPKS